ncbi:MAG: SCO family protein [Planctomycetota bacterium]|nr:SCO family protein [Planctomycetota bacterium]
MTRTGMFALAVALLAGGLLLIGPQLAGRHRATDVAEFKTIGVEKDESFQPPKEWLTKYTLTERSGKKFDSETLAGRVQVVNFFFTACPTACPLQTQKVRDLDREFGPHGVHFLSITCDPETDTPAVLQQYAGKYNADSNRWLFLTGDMHYTRRIASEVYRVHLERFVHVEKLIVVDKWGKVRGYFLWNNPEQISSMKELLPALLAETEPPAEAPPVVQPAEDDPDDVEGAATVKESGDADAAVNQ